MKIITIREQQQTAEGFTATVSIDGQAYPTITVSDPFNEQQERDLEFYFEEWIQFPFDERVRAQRAAASLEDYGKQLFDDVFADRNAYSRYQQVCRDGLANLQIEIAGESLAFQALHWEALYDRNLPRPLAVDCVFTRKRFQSGGMQIDLRPSAVINLLVVTARPDEEKDVGYRTISRPLIEAIERGRLRVNVELLRPGTFEALREHLEGKAGFYHIVHFDVHGGLITYDELQKQVKRNRYVFKSGLGKAEIPEYEGLKAFLLLEGELPGQAEPLEAQQLADLLTGQGIPICILNACQSGKQVMLSGTETSLGSRLMAAGVQMVVAMGYTVTATAAVLMMETLYGQLFATEDGNGIPEAIRRGRKALYTDKYRRVYFNQIEPLEDWLLPVVYANQAVDLRLQPLLHEAEEAFFDREDKRYRFALPTFGFVGRDLEILKIEKALLRHNVLLLQGMGGTGKTTLLSYLRDWWQTTNFVKEVFYFGYDEKAHTLQQILQAIGKRVFSKFEFASFQAMGLGAQRRKLADVLKAQPYGIVLDNLESVTGEALAIQNTLPEAEREEIKVFLQALVGGQTKVVLGSRSDEAWLQPVFSFAGKVNRYRLGGLDAEARTVLAEKILASTALSQREIMALRQEKDFERLMKLLAGYPLAMEVVLANLARQSSAAVLAGLDAADVNLDSEAEDKTKSILKCVEYSHSNLSVEAQKLLLCLAPFKGFIWRNALLNYMEELTKLELFSDWTFDKFNPAIDEAMRWGLLSPYFEGDDRRLLRIQPVFPYFLKAKLAEVEEAVRERLATAFKEHYKGLAAYYKQMMESKESEQRKLGLLFCKLEYENLFSALQNCLAQQENLIIYFCLDEYLDRSKDLKSRLQLCGMTTKAKAGYSQESLEGAIGLEFVMAYLRLGNSYLQGQQYSLAQSNCQDALDLAKDVTDADLSLTQSAVADISHQLGIVAQELREYEQARVHYQQALDIKIELGDRYRQASTYYELGIVARELKEYEQARPHFQQALDIYIKFDDRYNQAQIYYQLGLVVEELKEYEQARAHYQQVLDIYIEFGDRYNQASTYHNLGTVALELREYEQARAHYQQALDIFIEFDDRYSQARTYHQLGNMALEFREYEQAQSHFQQALDIFIEFGDHYIQAGTYHSLGIAAHQLREYEQARAHYQQALDIYIEFDDRYIQASTYYLLGRVAQALREYEQARSHFRQALDIYIEYSDRYSQATVYHQLGSVAQELREYGQARSHYQQALDIKIEFSDRYEQADTYHQLGLLEEAQENYAQAQQHLIQALKIFVEFNDTHSAEITLWNLSLIYQTTQDASLLTEIAQCLSSTVQKVTQLFEQVSESA